MRDCVIAGGGPAGMVLGYLLARAGLRVTVLEKHADFLRDFRGDTIHPSTLTLLRELGLLERFLRLPLTRIDALDVVVDGSRLTMVDFRTLPGPEDFLVLAPQWEFLDFLATEAATFPGFDLRMQTTATALLREHGRVVGVRTTGPDGDGEVRARLTVAADGRRSALRDDMGVAPVEYGVPIDLLWFRLAKGDVSTPPTLAYLTPNGMVLTIDRGDYYQAGAVVPKGSFEQIRATGLPSFRERIARAVPHLRGPVDGIRDWDQVSLLSVQVNRLADWHRPGVIAIGDAAHAMSPMFGVGVNSAIQDAVALANAITPYLRRGTAPDDALASVQRRREVPTRRMQRLQVFGHRMIARRPRSRVAPRPLLALLRWNAPWVRRITARVIGVGFLPEHPTQRP